MVMVNKWDRWVMSKMRKIRVDRTDIEIGGVYMFAYVPNKTELKRGLYGGQDMMPLLILTSMNGRGLLGVNVKGLPDRALRIRVLENYKKSIETSDLKERLKGLMLISRTVQRQNPLKSAYKFFKWSDIRSKVVKLTPEELEEAITRIL